TVFAAETREPMLTAELPSAVRRVRIELGEELDALARTEAIRRTVTAQRIAQASRPVTKFETAGDHVAEFPALTRSLFHRLRAFIQRWLGSDDDVTEEAIDRIDKRLESADAHAIQLGE